MALAPSGGFLLPGRRADPGCFLAGFILAADAGLVLGVNAVPLSVALTDLHHSSFWQDLFRRLDGSWIFREGESAAWGGAEVVRHCLPDRDDRPIHFADVSPSRPAMDRRMHTHILSLDSRGLHTGLGGL